MQGGDTMHDKTITLFNLHNGVWYPSVIPNVTVEEVTATSATEIAGRTNADTVELSIGTSIAKAITTSVGVKAYVSPMSYAVCTAPADCFTFKTEQDFVYIGEWSTDPIRDDEYESGLYHALNEANDGFYMISSAAWLGLIPHFEIGGR